MTPKTLLFGQKYRKFSHKLCFFHPVAEKTRTFCGNLMVVAPITLLMRDSSYDRRLGNAQKDNGYGVAHRLQMTT